MFKMDKSFGEYYQSVKSKAFEIAQSTVGKAAAVGGGLTLLSNRVMAQTMPAGVETALDQLSTNAVTIATSVLIAIIAVFAIKFIRKGL